MNDLAGEKTLVSKSYPPRPWNKQFDPQSQFEILELNWDPQTQHEILNFYMRSSIPSQQARLATLLKVAAYFAEKE